MTCAKFRCDRLGIFETRALPILIEFRIRSKYRQWDGREAQGSRMLLGTNICLMSVHKEASQQYNKINTSSFEKLFKWISEIKPRARFIVDWRVEPWRQIARIVIIDKKNRGARDSPQSNNYTGMMKTSFCRCLERFVISAVFDKE